MNLCTVKFERMIQINLMNNKIMNIEALQFINAPALKAFGIQANLIVNVSSWLNKITLPNLTIIHLGMNLVL